MRRRKGAWLPDLIRREGPVSRADLAVREHLEKALRLPVVVDNDVNLAALGERHGGVAVGLRNFVLIRLITGIGGGAVACSRRSSRRAAGARQNMPEKPSPTIGEYKSWQRMKGAEYGRNCT